MRELNKSLIDNLIFKDTLGKDQEEEYRVIFDSAARLLEVTEPVRKPSLLDGSVDALIFLDTRELIIMYSSEQGGRRLALTNVYYDRRSAQTSEDIISVEIRRLQPPRHPSLLEKGEILFSVTRGGQLTSPSGLIDSNVAASLIKLFQESTQ